MDLGLKNKVIIVTGGARGIGEGIVRVLSGEGAVVVIVGRNQEDNLKLQNELEKSGAKLFSVEAELGEPTACEKVVKAVVQKLSLIHI